ncbi:MAG: hypothetical protein QOH27_3232, partial [Mycobacterium sp.]|nr:hypothetical protein [Mycobacterium sp.]
MIAGFNFLEQPELPAPQVSARQAEQLLATHYGVTARADSLGSQQDKNFLVFGDGKAATGVLKIANPAFTAMELEAQDAAAQLIADAEPAVRVAVPLPNLAGQPYTAVSGLLDDTAYVRLLRYLPGGTLVDDGYLSPGVVAGMGELAGRVSRALAGFTHPGLDRAVQWDLRYGKAVVDELISHVAEAALRDRIAATTDEAWARIASLAPVLPRQAVHLDLTDANTVASRPMGGAPRPDGVIDFGDLSDTWAVSELAITVSSVLGHPGNRPTSILPGVKAFHAIRPLSAAEADALWPLLLLRTTVLLVSDAQQATLDPDNEYVTGQTDAAWRMFEQALSVPIDVMTAVIRAELELAAPQDGPAGGPLVVGVDPASISTLDLSPTSEAFDAAFVPGAWLPSDLEDELARAAVHHGALLVVTRFGEPRLTRAPALSTASPDVVATGIGLWPATATELVAPWPGELTRDGGRLTLRGADNELTVSGADVAAAAGHVEAGDLLASAPADGWTQVTVRPSGAPEAPAFGSIELAAGWLAVTRDPRPLLGLRALAPTAASDLLARRGNSFARVQEHYYQDPPQIERGWRH